MKVTPIPEMGGIRHPEPHKTESQVKAISNALAGKMGHGGNK